uniref:hypothetical protein n=1 Tax=Actinokineospora sp. CA-119265 TaxID=3239890 RepID=UPI003F497037
MLVMPARPYPHARDDCDSCAARDADMTLHRGPGGPGQRLCQHCVGAVLAHLALLGHTVTVGPVDQDDEPADADVPAAATPSPAGEDAGAVHPVDVDGVRWTVDLAEQVLRGARPTASTFLRALVDEGGTATAARLRELTGTTDLRHATMTLHSSARRVARDLGTGARPQVAVPRPDPDVPQSKIVHDYTLPPGLLPLFDAALHRLGR